MLNKIFENLSQFAGDRGLLNPSVLIPENSINSELNKRFQGEKNPPELEISFEKKLGHLKAHFQKKINFTVSFDFVPAGIQINGERLYLNLQRTSGLEIAVKNRIAGFMVKPLANFTQNVIKYDLVRRITRNIPELTVEGLDITIELKLNDIFRNRILAKTVGLLGNSVKPTTIDFEEKGVRIGFTIL